MSERRRKHFYSSGVYVPKENYRDDILQGIADYEQDELVKRLRRTLRLKRS